MKPTFIIIGAQRSGATWTHECLREHPDVFTPLTRTGWEFDEDASRQYAGQKATGIVSSQLIYNDNAPGKIAEMDPDVTWLLLREPVSPAYSWYLNMLRHGDGIYSTKLSFEEAIEQDASIIEGGRYYTHIQRFLEVLPRENFVPMSYDQMQDDPEAYLARLFAAIGVDPDFKPSLLGKRVVYSARNRSDRIHQFARAAKTLLTRITGNRYVHWLERSSLVEAVRALNERKPPRMEETTRKRLLELYMPEIEGLEKLLSWDLSKWKQ